MLRRRPPVTVSRIQAFAFALAIGLVAFALVAPIIPDAGELSEGSTAPQTLVAQRSATYESEVLTDLGREEDAAAVTPILQEPDPAVRQNQLRELDRLLAEIRAIRGRGASLQEQLDELNGLEIASPLSAAGRTALLALSPTDFSALEGTARAALGTVLNERIEEPGATSGPLPSDRDEKIQVYLSDLTARDDPDPALSNTEISALQDLLEAFVVANVHIDEAKTEEARQQARDNAPTQSQTYTRGQVIAGEGAQLGAAEIEALQQTGYLQQGFDGYRVAAAAIMASGFGLLLGVFTYLLQPFPAAPVRRMFVTGVAILAALVAVRAVLPNVLPDQERLYFAYATPVAIAAMVTACLSDLPFAAMVAIVTGLFAAVVGASATDLAGADFTGSLEAFELSVAYVVTGLVGAVTVHRAERLSRFAFSALTVALALGAVLGAFWLVSEPRDTGQLPWIALASATNGILAAVFTVGFFVILSLAFGVTTRLQLMELAQSDHPLLRRLQDEAPGTYHHSMMVGTLAERAAATIGADALVARVGAYYHDIGKLAQPGYFIENMLDGAPSPHDTMRPEESAHHIRDHVTNGLEIARKYRLPGAVRDFIPEHHGTRLVTYFYRRAAQQGGEVDPQPYRYRGPRPHSKESAIVMLADSCEALVRASQQDDRARTRLDELVDSVFAERLAEGQLDECDITMREIQQVAGSFRATLRAVYHPRIEYPQPAPEEIAALAHNAPSADAPHRAGL
ncbi:MAG: HDIG domain-containing metalloprotein [Dehalococcoidia bacterium]